MTNIVRFIALYLPQYHPIPENDEWWGKGFTEWTNVAKAKPLFHNHYQPKIPSDLGFYDLRMPEIRVQQAELAKAAGIEGFCYWHYWFGKGKRLLERPFNEVVSSGKPDYPFCLCWANHSWSNKTWKLSKSKLEKNSVLMEQLYLGEEDYRNHFFALLDAFNDKRYIHVDGKPVFFIFNSDFPEVKSFINVWRKLASENGIGDFHFVAMLYSGSLKSGASVKERIDHIMSLGFDAVNTIGNTRAELEVGKIKSYAHAILSKFFKTNTTIKYKQSDINKHMFSDEDKLEYVYPTVMPNWDRSPRCGKACVIYTDSTPEVFEEHLEDAINLVKHKKYEHRIVTIRSWNEWGEGNYLEPDLKYGHGYLDAIKEALKRSIK